MPSTGFVFRGGSGCLLPMLIILNLFFGRLIFNSTRLWLGVEVALILLFIIKIHFFARRISEQLRSAGQNWQQNSQSDGGVHCKRNNVVDVSGEVVEENKKLE